ncbi:MAG: alanine--glyoxylate aminotransferase family protein [Phycisphaerales bacterium]|nr:alanine--glyoxylate aminotransferase family protein [Phycisphaerales bacterium]
MKKIRLFTPGPCQTPEEALIEMARPFEHHRTDWFKDLLKDCTKKLQKVIKTDNDVLIITGSGTAAAEGAIVGCCPPGSKLLTIEGGKFGQRWGEIAQQFGIEVTRHAVPWGTAIQPQEVKALLDADPAITAVMVVHSETSTATACDLEGIGKVTGDAGKLLLVDGITSAGALPLYPDKWNVDVVITGSQKALMLPPGLGFVSVSDRAWKVIEGNAKQSTYYLNLAKARKAATKYDTPYTPAHLLVRGLNITLDLLLDEGIENVWKRVATMAAMTRAAGEAVGMKVFSKHPSDSVTAFEAPNGIDVGEISKFLKKRYGIHTAGGQDELKGRIIRFSHMGWLDELDMLVAIGGIEQALYALGHKFDIGAGVRAAQAVLAERSAK